jgi:hypothetical protein
MGYIALKMFLGISYTLDLYQAYPNVPTIY